MYTLNTLDGQECIENIVEINSSWHTCMYTNSVIYDIFIFAKLEQKIIIIQHQQFFILPLLLMLEIAEAKNEGAEARCLYFIIPNPTFPIKP